MTSNPQESSDHEDESPNKLLETYPEYTTVLQSMGLTTNEQITKFLTSDITDAEISKYYGSARGTDKDLLDSFSNRNTTDRSDRATVENVLDPATRMILFKLINSNLISEIDGCLSTGKEANVYHATRSIHDQISQCAIKIYKTAILSFKDRDRYISGEFRFRKYNKSSTRSMIRLWAEKEFRNLKRLTVAGVPCPEPIHVQNNVMIMGFIGDRKGYPAPRLKDVEFSENFDELWWQTYVQCLKYIRIMYQSCQLVHGDLSEYNMLFYKEKLYFIDVSQSVEPDHPQSLEFLRQDIKNISDFFRRKNVNVFSERETFGFVTNKTQTTDEDKMTQQLAKLQITRDARSEEERAQEEIEDQVFRQQFIPQNLDQVYEAEIDPHQIDPTNSKALIYNALADRRIVTDQSGEDEYNSENGSENDSENDDDDDSDSDTSQNFDKTKFRSGNEKPLTKRTERLQDPDAKKTRKEEAKSVKREARAKKMPKKQKKALVAATSRPKKR